MTAPRRNIRAVRADRPSDAEFGAEFDLRALCEYLNISVESLLRHPTRGLFTNGGPLPTGLDALRWRKDEIDAWVDRVRGHRVCDWCGGRVAYTVRTSSKWCSDSCSNIARQRRYRARQREQQIGESA